MDNIAFIAHSDAGVELAKVVKTEIPEISIFSVRESESVTKITSTSEWLDDNFNNYDAIVFVGALGICIRSIAKHIVDKKSDPAIISIDVNGYYVQSVLSGHVGGANEFAKRVARITGGEAIITTASDSMNLWSLDTIAEKYNWKTDIYNTSLNEIISLFVNGEKTALVLEAKDNGSEKLLRTVPDFADVYYSSNEFNHGDYKLIIAVSHKIIDTKTPCIVYRPAILHVGIGCRKDIDKDTFVSDFITKFNSAGYSEKSVASVNSTTIKEKEEAIIALAKYLGVDFNCYSNEQLNSITEAEHSDKVYENTGLHSVSEASAMFSAKADKLTIDKQKETLPDGLQYTYAAAINVFNEYNGHVEIVGAGPGDPELVSVRGKEFLKRADLILYAGSLVPEELTHYAKPGATVRSSAPMNLQEQVEIMKEFYDKKKLVVRLHTGDPCIYGAIQEQMRYFDEYGWSYAITPGISSFQAAASRLKAQFTIPGGTQTIILTRGEGRTLMPDSEQLEELAQSKSTMCIYLSATLADKVQEKLLTHYPPETPVAVCHKLTWKEEKIFKGQLKDLAKIVNENKLTLTTMMVVGDAIENREGDSRLYAHDFKHLYR
ncbi:MAG: precorrin-4 C(11)-methyltransferase [Bacteroidales bacterium]|jgi:precorrin-4 C11-methyltransferase|nr:precorrin-4 C(11)-methyltransferase [Bacteroidales bacterium]